MDKIYFVCALGRSVIELGRQLDNGVTRIVFDVQKWLEEYPNGTISGYVQPPKGDGYPIVLKMEGTNAVWEILESDTAHDGMGMVQLALYGADGKVKHSANANTKILYSAHADAGGEPPNAAKPWFDDVQKRLERIEQSGGVTDEQVAGAVESYLEKNPDAAGAKIDDAQAGEKTTFSGKHIDELLSAQKTAIDNKLDADKLPTAINTALAQAKESGQFDGKDGEPGAPGYTPQKGVDYFDGAPGEPGEPGYTPQRGTDYWTAADKQQIVTDVLAALPNASGVSF